MTERELFVKEVQDNKMTDNEITRKKTFSEELPHFKERIKEVFDNYKNPNGSEDPLYICVLRDSNRIVRKAEEEIACQKAEIKRLKLECYKLYPKGSSYSMQVEASDRLEHQIKSEARKEFSEKLKKRFYLCAGRCVVDVYHIDNLVKEMAGDIE